MNKSPIFILSLLLLMSFAAAQVEEVSCWDHYKFDEKGYEILDLVSEEDEFSAGEMLFYSGEFKNNVDITLPEIRILIQVWYFDQGIESLADEFFVDIGMVDPNEVVDFKGAYLIPENAYGGNYIFEAYALQGNYPLDGTPFIRGDAGARLHFTVESSADGLFFDPSTIFYDDTQITLHSSITDRIFSSDEDAKFTAVLVDTGSPKQVTLEKELYYWDDLGDFKIKDLPKEKLNVDEIQEVNMNLGKLGSGTYVLKLIATSGDKKALLNLRFSVFGYKPKIWYSAVEKYPLVAGEENSLLLCVGDMAPTMTPFFMRVNGTLENPIFEGDEEDELPSGKVMAKMTLTSSTGKTMTEEFEISVPYDDIQGYKIDFTPDSSYSTFSLDIEIDEPDYNEESLSYVGEEIDEEPPAVPPEEPPEKPPDEIPKEEPTGDMTPIIIIIVVLILLGVLILYKKKLK